MLKTIKPLSLTTDVHTEPKFNEYKNRNSIQYTDVLFKNLRNKYMKCISV